MDLGGLRGPPGVWGPGAGTLSGPRPRRAAARRCPPRRLPAELLLNALARVSPAAAAQRLTEWLTPHMKTLSTGSLARNTFTFCWTKCFFFVLVFGARITIGLEAAPEFPRAAMTAGGEAGAGGDTSSCALPSRSYTPVRRRSSPRVPRTDEQRSPVKVPLGRTVLGSTGELRIPDGRCVHRVCCERLLPAPCVYL